MHKTRKHQSITCPACGTRIRLPASSGATRARIFPDPEGRPLEWLAGPDRDMNWYEACQWIKPRKASGWRMPGVDDLKGLAAWFGRNSDTTGTTGWWIWSAEPDGPLSAKGLDIGHGQIYTGGRELDSGGRVFAVRATGTDTIRP